MNILLVDDEPAILTALRPVLTAMGHEVFEAETARGALQAMKDIPLQLILLDLGLPDADGLQIISKLKQETDASIVILSARHLEDDKVHALDQGADDYIDKPFSLEELMARIRVVERRHSGLSSGTSGKLVTEEITIDPATRQVTLFGEPVKLSPKEYALLEVLCRNAGSIVTHKQLMIAGWDNPKVDGQYLRGYIALLRSKLEAEPSDPRLLVTEPGIGYRLNVKLLPPS